MRLPGPSGIRTAVGIREGGGDFTHLVLSNVVWQNDHPQHRYDHPPDRSRDVALETK